LKKILKITFNFFPNTQNKIKRSAFRPKKKKDNEKQARNFTNAMKASSYIYCGVAAFTRPLNFWPVNPSHHFSPCNPSFISMLDKLISAA